MRRTQPTNTCRRDLLDLQEDPEHGGIGLECIRAARLGSQPRFGTWGLTVLGAVYA
jgi:hypothetical protein